MNLPVALIVLSLLTLSILACNAPLPQSAVLPTQTQQDTPIPHATAPSDTQEADTAPAPDAAFNDKLTQALIAEDFAQIKEMMGDAFLIRYVGGEGGMIAVNDAISLLRTNLLSGPNSIALEPTIDPETVAGDALRALDLTLNDTLFSTGWGPANADQAIILIGQNASGEPTFVGLIYTANGFAALATPATQVSEAETVAPTAAAPKPAPRGPITYESDFKRNWPLFDDDHVKTQVTSEGYVINVTGTWSHWSFTQLGDTDDYYAEVTATPTDCPESQGSYGLIFDYLDTDEFRVFVIECHGIYTLWERTPISNGTVLSTGRLPEGIDARGGEHRIGILAEDGSLTMYIDDYRLGTVGVADAGPGDFGPYVETTGSATMSALFTRLAIYESK